MNVATPRTGYTQHYQLAGTVNHRSILIFYIIVASDVQFPQFRRVPSYGFYDFFLILSYSLISFFSFFARWDSYPQLEGLLLLLFLYVYETENPPFELCSALCSALWLA